MKKFCFALLIAGMVGACFAGAAGAETSGPIRVSIDGDKQIYSVDPILMNGSVMVPMRAILASLGAGLHYDAKTRVITASKGDTRIVLKVGSHVAKVNDREVKMNQPAVVIQGSTFVPVRFVSEALGAEVKWVPQVNTVVILSAEILMLDAALKEDNLEKFASILKQAGNPTLANRSFLFVLNHKKGTEWVAAALDAGADVFKPFNIFHYAIMYKRTDVVKFLLDDGFVDPSAGSSDFPGYSYIGLAFFSGNIYTSDVRGNPLGTIQAGPSFEIAEALYEKGFRAETLDAYWTLASGQPEWFDWMLAHGADPDGEIPKLVYLDEAENRIEFHSIQTMPDRKATERLINAVYSVVSWNPSPENLQMLETLIVKYGASLDPLTQAEKNRLLQLAKSKQMQSLVDSLIKAGAKV